LSTAITRSLKVSVPAGATGQVGFANAGYLGVPVNADTYANYFWVKGNYTGPVTLSLYGPSGKVYANKTLTITSNSNAFTYYETTYASTQSYESNNAWKLNFNASLVAGSALYFDLIQLFPITYHSRYAPSPKNCSSFERHSLTCLRYNGLRKDVATYLEQINPSFLRFPGGNNMYTCKNNQQHCSVTDIVNSEGSSPDNRWKWNETIGPVHMRPGRQGDWGYPNTDALGTRPWSA